MGNSDSSPTSRRRSTRTGPQSAPTAPRHGANSKLPYASITDDDKLVADVELPRDVQACPRCGVTDTHGLHD
jgi:hypothetical protein